MKAHPGVRVGHVHLTVVYPCLVSEECMREDPNEPCFA